MTAHNHPNEAETKREWVKEIVASGGQVERPLWPFAYLNFEEQEEQARWAKENYKPFTPIDGLWHPIAQFECVRINAKAGYPRDLKHPYNKTPTKTQTKTTESFNGNNSNGSGA